MNATDIPKKKTSLTTFSQHFRRVGTHQILIMDICPPRWGSQGIERRLPVAQVCRHSDHFRMLPRYFIPFVVVVLEEISRLVGVDIEAGETQPGLGIMKPAQEPSANDRC